MKKLILASNNQKKIKEMKDILKDIEIEVLSLKDINLDIDVIEDGDTFEENAIKKSREIYKELLKLGFDNFIVMSDDSGLCVDYLNGAPGVYSARYAGEHGNDKLNNEKLLSNLKGINKEDRTARFICHIALIDDKETYVGVRGEVEGYILEEERGSAGFGYDPLFLYEPLNKSFAELSSYEKNKISHRGKALNNIKDKILSLL